MYSCNPSCSGVWGKRIAWTKEVEFPVSQDCATTHQPKQQNETLSKKKNSLNLLLVISVVSNYSQIDNAGGNLVITMAFLVC